MILIHTSNSTDDEMFYFSYQVASTGSTHENVIYKRSFFTGSSNFEQKRQKLSDQAMSCRARERHLSSGGKCLRACVAGSVRCDGLGKW